MNQYLLYITRWKKQSKVYAILRNGCLFKNCLEKYIPLLKITNSKQEIDYKV